MTVLFKSSPHELNVNTIILALICNDCNLTIVFLNATGNNRLVAGAVRLSQRCGGSTVCAARFTRQMRGDKKKGGKRWGDGEYGREGEYVETECQKDDLLEKDFSHGTSKTSRTEPYSSSVQNIPRLIRILPPSSPLVEDKSGFFHRLFHRRGILDGLHQHKRGADTLPGIHPPHSHRLHPVVADRS